MAIQVRPPVVTILGHVDHGKTSLLDFIRKSTVAAGEHGGITQAIGAYQVEISEKGQVISQDNNDRIASHVSRITFIDTPGHAAFEKMRSRGARVADIAVLVVAVDDGIMPQTIEAIKHIQEAKVPMIVAVNKVDLPEINVKVQLEKIKKQLSDHQVLAEEYGGETPIVGTSAKTGLGVDNLLETITLVAQIHELTGDPSLPPSGVVIESHMDKFKGALATLLIRDGTLKKGDQISVGGVKCKVKAMYDWQGQSLGLAGPSTPVEVLGWEGVPGVGAALGSEEVKRIQKLEVKSLIERMKQSETDILNVVVRADTQGSLEAIEENLAKFNEEGEHLKVILSGTGEVVDSDVHLAESTKAIVIGFNVPVRSSAQKIAETQHVLVRSYNVIYELLDELKDVVEGMLVPGVVEEVFGRAQIIAEFPYGKDQKIAGCRILEGTFSKGPKVRLVRNEELVGEGKITSLKMAREEVNKVEKGQECGMMFSDLEFQIGDLVESFRNI